MIMNKKNILLQIFTVYFAVMFSGCDSMTTDIDIKSANLPPKLAVSSTINTGDSSFYIAFSEARSTGSYSNWRPEEETIIRKGKIILYDETAKDTIVKEESEGFDMSWRAFSPSYINGYFKIYYDLQFIAGHTYRLTLDIDGYPVATATAVMPEAPIIAEASADAQQTLHFNKAHRIEAFNPKASSTIAIDCSPLTLRLTDNSSQRDYYMAYLRMNNVSNVYNSEIAISDRAVIQDNPDIEASKKLMDGEPDAFLFDRMLFSDMSFANTTGIINLLVDKNAVKPYYDKYPEPPCNKDRRELATVSLCIAHLTDDSYAHYRSVALQKAGMDFFSEPVPIVSNIENGYGCFSAINTVMVKIAEYEKCASEF
jgi:hypothetical protein